MIMKTPHLLRSIAAALTAVFSFFAAPGADAQYYEIANQIPGLVQPALSGSMSYRGFVELSGLTGFGENRANFVGVSTSQGFQYADWFYMGVGLGVDVVATAREKDTDVVPEGEPAWGNHGSTRTKAMIPVFSDFRFKVGIAPGVSLYAGAKFGAAWLLGNDYLRLNKGRIGGATQFYLRPSLGVRFAFDKNKPARALTVALTYQLLTSNNNWDWYGQNDVTLNSLGMTISYEFGR